jgi:hypothetical protein
MVGNLSQKESSDVTVKLVTSQSGWALALLGCYLLAQVLGNTCYTILLPYS